MTRIEVAAILHRLAAAYRAEVSEAEAEVWAHHLASLDQAVGFAATDRLIATTDGYMPTIAKFRDVYRAESRRIEFAPPALPEAPPRRLDPGELKAMLADTRSRLPRGQVAAEA